MSKVGSTEAEDVVAQLGLVWVDGNKLFPIRPPPGGSFLPVPAFNMHLYSCEKDATEPFGQYFEVSVSECTCVVHVLLIRGLSSPLLLMMPMMCMCCLINFGMRTGCHRRTRRCHEPGGKPRGSMRAQPAWGA